MAASFIKRRRREEAARRAAEITVQKESARREEEMVAPWINKTQPKKAAATAPVVSKPVPVVAAEVEAPEEIAESVVEVISVEKIETEEVDTTESTDLDTLRKFELIAMATDRGLDTKGLTKSKLIKLLEE